MKTIFVLLALSAQAVFAAGSSPNPPDDLSQCAIFYKAESIFFKKTSEGGWLSFLSSQDDITFAIAFADLRPDVQRREFLKVGPMKFSVTKRGPTAIGYGFTFNVPHEQIKQGKALFPFSTGENVSLLHEVDVTPRPPAAGQSQLIKITGAIRIGEYSATGKGVILDTPIEIRLKNQTWSRQPDNNVFQFVSPFVVENDSVKFESKIYMSCGMDAAKETRRALALSVVRMLNHFIRP